MSTRDSDSRQCQNHAGPMSESADKVAPAQQVAKGASQVKQMPIKSTHLAHASSVGERLADAQDFRKLSPTHETNVCSFHPDLNESEASKQRSGSERDNPSNVRKKNSTFKALKLASVQRKRRRIPMGAHESSRLGAGGSSEDGQVSTSFVSSSYFFSGGETSESRASSISLTCDVGAASLKSAASTGDIGKRLLPTGAAECLLKRSAISRSMLNLDQTIKPDDSFEVVWQNLTFSYERSSIVSKLLGRQRQAPVLDDISGRFRSNQLVAVIGPSGCGKTTLLQFLAGNQAVGQQQMRIVGIDEPKVAYIGQDDDLLPGLTARETLAYASRLQNSRPNFDHARHIQPILNELGLAECADRNIEKLSGGQAKRVNIAQELLYPTNLLILDEVTSGLDASTSYSIVKLLKYLVSDRSYPMSIVMSIHQPSARLFSVFDRVYVMSEGSCLYEGGCQVETINRHLDLFGLQCPRFHNIADHLIEIACSSGAFNEELTRTASHRKNQGAGEDEDGREGAAEEKFGGSVKQRMVRLQAKLSANLFAEVHLHERAESDECAQQHSPSTNDEHLFDGSFVPDGVKSAGVGEGGGGGGGGGGEQSVSLLVNNGATERSQGARRQDGEPPGHSLYGAIERARRRRARPLLDQLLVHLSRSAVRIGRSWILTYLQLATYVLLGLQVATFYGDQIGTLSGCPRLPGNLMSYILRVAVEPATGEPSEADDDETTGLEIRRIQENMNFLLVSVLTATFAALEITVITFPLEAKAIKREWCNGWYRVTSYFLGRTLADLPFTLLFVSIFCALIYKLTGQLGGLASWRFASFLAVVLATALIAQSFGFIFGAAFMNNLPAAVFTAPLAIFPALLFSGFFSRVSHIPALYRPLTFVSHFRYSFDALLVTLYGRNRCECDQSALDQYHAGLRNQTQTMREVFHLMLGCEPPHSEGPAGSLAAQVDENLIERDELATINASSPSLGALLSSTASATAALATSQRPALGLMPALSGSLAVRSSIEDALVESLFEHMRSRNATANTTTTTTTSTTTISPADWASEAGGEHEMSALDRMSHKFATRVTRMLSRQANFGHPMARECTDYRAYLLQEFGLNDSDLFHGLLMLLIFVLASRLICGLILSRTIAVRAK